MAFKAIQGLALTAGMACAVACWADDGRSGDGRSFDSYHNPVANGFWHDHDSGFGHDDHHHVSNLPEPAEWFFMGLGLTLIGIVAHRRRTRR